MIRLSAHFREQFWDWCMEQDIVCEYMGTVDTIDAWYIGNERDRMWAVLRWS